MKVCKTKEVNVMINQRINWCFTFHQGKCPHFTEMERFFLFPQILNAIDIELAEGKCLDCDKYIDRRVSQQSSSRRRDVPSKRATMAPEIEKRQHGRTAARLPIHILAPDGSRQGETEDISLGGAFTRCEKPPPPGSKVLLTYENRSGNKQYVIARVVWTNFESRSSCNKTIGMGVEFL
jgi:hypothetical protein